MVCYSEPWSLQGDTVISESKFQIENIISFERIKEGVYLTSSTAAERATLVRILWSTVGNRMESLSTAKSEVQLTNIFNIILLVFAYS